MADEDLVTVGTSKGGRKFFHPDDTCRYVQQMNTTKEIPRSEAEAQDLLVCSVCDGMGPLGRTNPDRRASLEDILAGRA